MEYTQTLLIHKKDDEDILYENREYVFAQYL
jgi:hypothetical protein